jgi:hypothetical protein
MSNQSNKPNLSSQIKTPNKPSLPSQIKILCDSVRKNSALAIVGSFGGIAVYLMGVLVNYIALQDTMTRPDPRSGEGWILVNITGFGYTSYSDNAWNILPWNNRYLSRSSRIISMVYTDAISDLSKINEADTNPHDVSVLKNSDFDGKVSFQTGNFIKKNSQTFQSYLMQAKESKIPVCLYVYGIRNGQESHFLNILKVKPLKVNLKTLPDYENRTKLAEDSCGKPITKISG